MKKTMLLIAGILLVAGVVSAQPGTIAVYGDPSLNTCDVSDAAVFTLYVFHINTNGSSASQFKLEATGGATGFTVLGKTSPYLTLGEPFEGISIAYQTCLGGFTGPFEILNITILGSGASPACSRIEVVPDPDVVAGEIEILDCVSPVPNQLVGNGSGATLNSDGSCNCTPPVPAEDTSWGKIKAIYN